MVVLIILLILTQLTITNVAGVTNDPVAYLMFDNNTNDSSGRNNNGMAYGSPGYVTGLLNQAIELNSAAKYVSFGTPVDLSFGTSTDFSVSFWIKSFGVTGDPSIISNKNWASGANTGWVIGINQNQSNGIEWNYKGASGPRKDMDIGMSVNDNKWHHIVVSHDRDANADFYEDGVYKRSVSIADSTGTIDSGLPTVVGQDGTLAYPYYLNANIDDFRIFRHTLNATDVTNLYHTALGTTPTPSSTPAPTPSPYHGYYFYYGDFHAHTSYSDGSGTPAQAYAQAKSSGKADFLAITDHNSSLTTTEWNDMQTQANNYSDVTFVAFPAWEFTNFSEAHMNTFNTGGTLVTDGSMTRETWYTNYLQPNQTWLAQWNHPIEYSNNFDGFADHNSQTDNVIKMIEVYNGCCPGYDYFEWSYQRALDAGWHVGPVANSDTHNPNWITGYEYRTAVLAPSLTRTNIIDAVRNNRVYATEDRNLRVCFDINGVPFGSRLANPANCDIVIDVQDPDTGNNNEQITKLEIIGDHGVVIATNTFSTFNAHWALTIPTTSSYYYLRVTNAAGKKAWTAPVWTGAVAATPTPAPTSPPGPVVHLTFDGNTNDSSGYGNNGVTHGAPTFVAGRIGNAISLNTAKTDYVSLGTNQDNYPDLRFGETQDFSISVWIKVSSAVTGDPPIISNKWWNRGDHNGFVMYLQGSNWKWNLKPELGARRDLASTTNITNNAWHYLVVTVDRDGYEKMYEDGVYKTQLYIGDSPGFVDSGLPVGIGEDGTLQYTYGMQGCLDDLRIYKRALSDTEVTALYNGGPTPTPGPIATPTPTSAGTATPTPTPGPGTAWWKFDEGSGTTAADSWVQYWDLVRSELGIR